MVSNIIKLNGITIEVNRNTAGLNHAIKGTLDLASAMQQKTKYILIFCVSYVCLTMRFLRNLGDIKKSRIIADTGLMNILKPKEIISLSWADLFSWIFLKFKKQRKTGTFRRFAKVLLSFYRVYTDSFQQVC